MVTIRGRAERRCRIADQPASGASIKLIADDEELAAGVVQSDGSFLLEALHDASASYDLEIDLERAHLPDHDADYHVELLLRCADPAGRVGHEPAIALKLVPPGKSVHRPRARLNTSEIPRAGERVDRVPADQAGENPAY